MNALFKIHLHDQFALQAMIILLPPTGLIEAQMSYREFAIEAYRVADAMMVQKEMQKKHEKRG